MSKNFLFFDIETTSVDIIKAQVIEFGYTLTDENLGIIHSGSFLIKPTCPLDGSVINLLKIDDEFIKLHGFEKSVAFEKIKKLFSQATYIVAHNGLKFDLPILSKELDMDISDGKIIIDTLKHLPASFYSECDDKKLKTLCIEKGVFFPQAHRASLDIALLFALFYRFKKDLNEIIENAKKLVNLYKIDVSYDDRDKAKAIGGTWNGEAKRWEIELDETEMQYIANQRNIKFLKMSF